MTGWLYVDVKKNNIKIASTSNPKLNWQSILYHGEDTGEVPHASSPDGHHISVKKRKEVGVQL
jgi:hypothetical protein